MLSSDYKEPISFISKLINVTHTPKRAKQSYIRDHAIVL